MNRFVLWLRPKGDVVMNKILAGFALIAGAYFVLAYRVEIKVTENSSSACDIGDPGCG